jgi:hypothetical protein
MVLEELAWKISQNPSLASNALTLEYLKDHPIDSSLWNLSAEDGL